MPGAIGSRADLVRPGRRDTQWPQCIHVIAGTQFEAGQQFRRRARRSESTAAAAAERLEIISRPRVAGRCGGKHQQRSHYMA
jgi:hypothetical protein